MFLMKLSETGKNPMTNEALTQELVLRLNNLIKNAPEFNANLLQLLNAEVTVSEDLAKHPDVMHMVHEDNTLSVLGLLNLLAGVFQEGPKEGYGRITVGYQSHEDGSPDTIVEFSMTQNPIPVTTPTFELVGPPCKVQGCAGVSVTHAETHSGSFYLKCSKCGQVETLGTLAKKQEEEKSREH